MQKKILPRLAILGAGISGLTLARKIPSGIFQEINIFEKSKAIGGRWATRRIRDNAYKCDHGSQFYSPRNNPWHAEWLSKGLSKKWFQFEDQDCWASSQGLSALAKDLAVDLKIQFERKIIKIKKDQSDFQLIDELGRVERADLCALSAPLPQILDIFKSSQISYPQELQSCAYDPCLVGFFTVPLQESFKSLVPYSRPGSGNNIFSISWQHSKISQVGKEVVLVVQMKSEWSQNHFDEEAEEETLKMIWQEASLNLKLPIEPTYQELKKWRYSLPLSPLEKDFLEVEPGLFVFGDAFSGHLPRNDLSSSSSRAFYSAESLAKELVSKF